MMLLAACAASIENPLGNWLDKMRLDVFFRPEVLLTFWMVHLLKLSRSEDSCKRAQKQPTDKKRKHAQWAVSPYCKTEPK